jgi:hypothetical protein
MVAQGIGLSWGKGVLTFKGQNYPFTFQETGLFRDVDVAIAAGEMSGQVFDLKNPADFSGNYQKADSVQSGSGGGTRATMKNQKVWWLTWFQQSREENSILPAMA